MHYGAVYVCLANALCLPFGEVLIGKQGRYVPEHHPRETGRQWEENRVPGPNAEILFYTWGERNQPILC